ncbi:40S ribosomal protein S25 [Astathelohania contejeani]|uniref:40S ribosomal protein S25 n=1 Tax=Astathelohania contejeani TaxID=164912 RepID=A0ABQ7I026_9MICR|nr:40S ribosomal protein S25 [Thelohania contejeani]
MVKKVQESKAAKLSKIQKTSSKEKKKWGGNKASDTTRRAVCADVELKNRIAKDCSNMSIVTKTTLGEKYKLNLGLAEKYLKFLCESGVLVLLSKGRGLNIYTSAAKAAAKAQMEEKTVPVVECSENGWGEQEIAA